MKVSNACHGRAHEQHPNRSERSTDDNQAQRVRRFRAVSPKPFSWPEDNKNNGLRVATQNNKQNAPTNSYLKNHGIYELGQIGRKAGLLGSERVELTKDAVLKQFGV